MSAAASCARAHAELTTLTWVLVKKLHLHDRSRVNNQHVARLSKPLKLPHVVDALDVEEIAHALGVNIKRDQHLSIPGRGAHDVTRFPRDERHPNNRSDLSGAGILANGRSPSAVDNAPSFCHAPGRRGSKRNESSSESRSHAGAFRSGSERISARTSRSGTLVPKSLLVGHFWL